MKTLKAIGFYTLSFTWGILMTLFGCLVAIALMLTGHRPHKYYWYIYFTVGKGWGGFEAGPFFIRAEDCENVSPHECGHGIQNIIWGPLMPFVISIPSCIRYWYREYQDVHWKALLNADKITLEEYYFKFRNRPDYDDMWFEGQATRWGQKYFPKLAKNDPEPTKKTQIKF